MSYVCHQCKQALQLDASLEDLSPSAYDMIASSLPPAQSLQSRPTLPSEKLAQLPSPTSVKAAWQRSAQSNPPSPPHSPREHQAGLRTVHAPQHYRMSPLCYFRIPAMAECPHLRRLCRHPRSPWCQISAKYPTTAAFLTTRTS
ncbi:hypothetical protein BC629DRAFT_890866 [Irpex lacteus]|nr:hypothetical protein BC629DRAFT_890866 [Irpex lacteus]